MWRFVALLIVLYGLCNHRCDGRHIDEFQDVEWTRDVLPKDLLQRNVHSYDDRSSINVYDDNPKTLEPEAEKRGFAIIARWAPFSELGKHQTPIRSRDLDNREFGSNLDPKRRLGAPLRWG